MLLKNQSNKKTNAVSKYQMAIVAKHISGMLTILRAAMFVDNAEEFYLLASTSFYKVVEQIAKSIGA